MLAISAAPVLSVALADDPPKRTEIVVLGTVHRATANFTKDRLVQILEELRPAAILFELDSSFMEKELSQLLPQFRTITLEAEAVTAFQEKTHVPVLPYDIEGRNQIYRDHNYFNLQTEFSKAVTAHYRQNQLGTEARALFEEVVDTDRLGKAFNADRPEVINSASCDEAMVHKHKSRRHIRRIIEVTPGLARFAEFAKFDDEFWERRNSTMVTNILKHGSGFSGKRIAVLCGFEHRYYLIRSLKEAEATSSISVIGYLDRQ